MEYDGADFWKDNHDFVVSGDDGDNDAKVGGEYLWSVCIDD